MQEGVFITPQEVMEPVLNEALIDYESRRWLKAVKIKLSFPQQIVEKHEHVRDANQLGARHDLHRRRTTHKRLQEEKLGNLGKKLLVSFLFIPSYANPHSSSSSKQPPLWLHPARVQ